MSFFSGLIERLEEPFVTMEVIASERIGSHIQKVVLSFPHSAGLRFDIGCYITPMIGGSVPRSYSIAEWTDSTCTIIVSFSGMGVGSRFFASAPVGTRIEVYGPYSDYPYRYGTGRTKVFLATGTGVSPFVRMVPEAINEGMLSLLVLGVPREQDIPYHDYFERLGSSSELFSPVFVLSRPGPGWKGSRGYVTEQFTGKREEWLRTSDVYVCGVPGMIESSRAMLRRLRVPKEQIFVQQFG
ncbi:MAG TPA: FAD-dependent oxidoreductase [Candidatus Paceibacterota bacterium]|nr:FAD-dependent oxidoreductase [Candidatus Paceibacterota bacterium]